MVLTPTSPNRIKGILPNAPAQQSIVRLSPLIALQSIRLESGYGVRPAQGMGNARVRNG
jgi:hypothetical protein